MITNNIPFSSTVRTVIAEVVGTYVPAVSEYQFSGVSNLLQMEKNSLYLMDQLTICSNITQDSYFEGAVPPLNLEFLWGLDGLRCDFFPDFFPVSAVNQPVPLSAPFFSGESGQSLNVSITGAINQVPGIIGVSSVRMQVSAVVYRITDQQFISGYVG